MGLKDRFRATLGALKQLPDVHRRVLRLEEQAAHDTALLAEVNQRTLALSHQVEHIESLLSQVDPQATNDIAIGVRDSVRELSIELTEQANRTSELLAQLSERAEST
ncbi:MAG: hypothetical protein GY812_10505 [Actinomycetia bacterium]|nr:hypothetical protein [Actinomycetes bacterium]